MPQQATGNANGQWQLKLQLQLNQVNANMARRDQIGHCVPFGFN